MENNEVYETESVNDAVADDERLTPREPSEHEKRLRRDLARTREQVKAAQADRDERVAQALRAKEEAISALKAQTTGRVIAAELKAHAIKAGIVDVDALRLADTSLLVMSDDGVVSGAELLIETLKVEKPYLFNEPRAGGAAGTTGHPGRPPAPASPVTLDARTLSRDAWQAERERLLGGVPVR